MNTPSPHKEYYPIREGLLESTEVLVEDEKEVWFVSPKSIFCYEKSTKSWKVFPYFTEKIYDQSFDAYESLLETEGKNDTPLRRDDKYQILSMREVTMNEGFVFFPLKLDRVERAIMAVYDRTRHSFELFTKYDFKERFFEKREDGIFNAQGKLLIRKESIATFDCLFYEYPHWRPQMPTEWMALLFFYQLPFTGVDPWYRGSMIHKEDYSLLSVSMHESNCDWKTGLLKYDAKTKTITRYTSPPNAEGHVSIAGNEQNLWGSAKNGVFRYNLETKTIESPKKWEEKHVIGENKNYIVLFGGGEGEVINKTTMESRQFLESTYRPTPPVNFYETQNFYYFGSPYAARQSLYFDKQLNLVGLLPGKLTITPYNTYVRYDMGAYQNRVQWGVVGETELSKEQYQERFIRNWRIRFQRNCNDQSFSSYSAKTVHVYFRKDGQFTDYQSTSLIRGSWTNTGNRITFTFNHDGMTFTGKINFAQSFMLGTITDQEGKEAGCWKTIH
jgi:hypothetical protein